MRSIIFRHLDPRSCFFPSLDFCLVLLTIAFLSLSSGKVLAQAVSFSGDKPSVSFGDLALCLPGVKTSGPCSETLTVTYKVTKSGTLGTPRVVTVGVPDLDFTMDSGSTCIGQVNAPGSCTVNVKFQPTQVGGRSGGVQILDGNGKVLATTFLFGNSLGAQLGFNPSAHIVHNVPVHSGVPNYYFFSGVTAVDAMDNIFIARGGKDVVELKADGSPPIEVGSFDMGEVLAMALDGAGDVFVDGYSDDFSSLDIVELPAGGGPQVRFTGQGSDSQDSVGVDGAGNLYVLDDYPGSVAVIAPGSASVKTVSLPPNEYNYEAMTVDGAGDIYALQAAEGPRPVVELPAGGGPYLTFHDPEVGGSTLFSIAADAVGGILGTEERGPLVQLGPGNTPAQNLAGFGLEFLVVTDTVGNPFVSSNQTVPFESYPRNVIEVNRGESSPLEFGNILLGNTFTLPLTISNNGNEPLIADASFDNPNYAITSMSPSHCLAGIKPAMTCVLQITFTPQQAGNQNAHLHLQTNAVPSTDVSLVGSARQPVPVFTPGSGVFSTSQMVYITDAQAGATIYYTTDGTMPTTSSTRYTGPISVQKTERLTAIGVASGRPASLGTAAYTITPAAEADVIDFSQGFAQSKGKLQFNGSTQLHGDRLELTDGGKSESGSAYFTGLMSVKPFNTFFTFQLTDPVADGFTFTIQNYGLNALGGAGQRLGYADFEPSLAIKFDLFSNDGEGPNSTGLYSAAALPTTPSINLAGTGIDLHSQDPFLAEIAYDGTKLVLTLTDTITLLTWSHTFPLDLTKALFGSTSAYVGFTGATGRAASIQEITSWTFVDGAPGIAPPPLAGNPGPSLGSGFSPSSVIMNGSATLSGTALQLTSGKIAEAGSAFYPTPVNVQKFTSDFSFRLTNPLADGFTFTIQNAGTGALSGAGQRLGYEGIGQSVAIKFDLHNNAGEGPNSTGVFVNGALPTVPSVDLTGSGIDLHSTDVIDVHLTYDGTNLQMTLTDAVTHATWSHTFAIYIPATVGSNTAYVGFTGSTGQAAAVQQILNWTFTNP